MEQLEAGIRQEYAKNYIWTGDINEDLYEVGGNKSNFLGSLMCFVFSHERRIPRLFRSARYCRGGTLST